MVSPQKGKKGEYLLWMTEFTRNERLTNACGKIAYKATIKEMNYGKRGFPIAHPDALSQVYFMMPLSLANKGLPTGVVFCRPHFSLSNANSQRPMYIRDT